MSNTKIVLYHSNLGQTKNIPILLRQLMAFLVERNILVLNQPLLQNEQSSQLYEQLLSLNKKAKLGIFIVEDTNLLQTFILAQMLYKQTKCLVFIKKTGLKKTLYSITNPNLHLYDYNNITDMINVLKLYGL